MVSSDQNCTVTFPIAYNNTNYAVAMCRENCNATVDVTWYWFGIWNKTKTQWDGRAREYGNRIGYRDRYISIGF